MLGEILRFLLEIVFTLFGAALIARAWMHAIRLPPFNPLARAIYQATNWLVLPLRKIIPAGNKIDWTSLVATWLSALVYLVLIWLVAIGALIPAALLPAAMGSALIMAIVGAQPDRLADADPGRAVLGQPHGAAHAAALDPDRAAARSHPPHPAAQLDRFLTAGPAGGRADRADGPGPPQLFADGV